MNILWRKCNSHSIVVYIQVQYSMFIQYSYQYLYWESVRVQGKYGSRVSRDFLKSFCVYYCTDITCVSYCIICTQYMCSSYSALDSNAVQYSNAMYVCTCRYARTLQHAQYYIYLWFYDILILWWVRYTTLLILYSMNYCTVVLYVLYDLPVYCMMGVPVYSIHAYSNHTRL